MTAALFIWFTLTSQGGLEKHSIPLESMELCDTVHTKMETIPSYVAGYCKIDVDNAENYK